MKKMKKFFNGMKEAGIFLLLIFLALSIVLLIFLAFDITQGYTGSPIMGLLASAFVFTIVFGIMAVFD